MLNRSMKLWPFCPELLPEETISSWFVRLAQANALTPAELHPIALPGAFRYTRDLDRYASDTMIDNLSVHAGVDAVRLANATFRRWAGVVFENDLGVNKLPWLPPAGWEASRCSFGQQMVASVKVVEIGKWSGASSIRPPLWMVER